MTIQIKNWTSFQHYKNRRPPWIRLYRDLLDDPDFHCLSGDSVKALIMMWLVASEDPTLEGILPPVEKLAFRLRISVAEMSNIIKSLEHWVDFDDSDTKAGCEQGASKSLAKSLHDAIPESEGDQIRGRSDKKRVEYSEDFVRFWEVYPKKAGKRTAYKAWKLSKDRRPDLETIVKIVRKQRSSQQWRTGYIPHPSTWLNGDHWDDEDTPPPETPSWGNGPVTAQESKRERQTAILQRLREGGDDGDE